jgi:hypothetical protein
MNSSFPPLFYKFVRSNGLSEFLLGCGLCFAIEKKNYSHIPIVLFFPASYCGYNVYKNRNLFIEIINNSKKDP